jgi:adsorption protein B
VPPWADSPLFTLAAALLPPLAWILLASGLDDLVVDILWLCRARSVRRPLPAGNLPEQRIALLLPLWQEAAVAGKMLDHNLAAIGYANFTVFAGVYPNDPATRAAVEAAARRHSRLEVCVLPHDGPTSKPDCLNWIYQHLLAREGERPFEIIVIHDAEDLIHPASLGWINACCGAYDMVQVPVLALATPAHEAVHGIYCDEFAEYQARDMPVRSACGAFVPSTGVGTGFRRAALDALGNRIFDTGALTEDYDIGVRLHRLGARQVALPVCGRPPVATREFFPRRFRAAVRQRTRWVTGNVLQSWERFGWGRDWKEAYWFWRDRKGLLGAPASLLANLIFLLGLLGGRLGEIPPLLLAANAVLFSLRMASRIRHSARIYGFAFGLLAPLRIPLANLLNTLAVAGAVARFAQSKLLRRPLRWLKTEHAYPSREALLSHKRTLDAVLAGSGYLDEDALAAARASLPEDADWEQHLVRGGWISEVQLREALALQHGMDTAHVTTAAVSPAVVRSVPRAVAERHGVAPYAVAEGVLLLAAVSPVEDAALEEIRRCSGLEPEVRLVSEGDYRALAARAAGA